MAPKAAAGPTGQQAAAQAAEAKRAAKKSAENINRFVCCPPVWVRSYLKRRNMFTVPAACTCIGKHD
eukprot:1161244-Pelagomonas_calceolata.AAC.1